MEKKPSNIKNINLHLFQKRLLVLRTYLQVSNNYQSQQVPIKTILRKFVLFIQTESQNVFTFLFGYRRDPCSWVTSHPSGQKCKIHSSATLSSAYKDLKALILLALRDQIIQSQTIIYREISDPLISQIETNDNSSKLILSVDCLVKEIDQGKISR